MPKMDGTGPGGEGPMTGRGRGCCGTSRPGGRPYGPDQGTNPTTMRFYGAGPSRFQLFRWFRSGGSGVYGGQSRSEGGRGRGRGRW